MDQLYGAQLGGVGLLGSTMWILLLLDAICCLHRPVVDHCCPCDSGLCEYYEFSLAIVADQVDRLSHLPCGSFKVDHTRSVHYYACCDLRLASSGLHIPHAMGYDRVDDM
jgi:hypothetical protein